MLDNSELELDTQTVFHCLLTVNWVAAGDYGCRYYPGGVPLVPHH